MSFHDNYPIPLFFIHSKSVNIGGVYFSGQQNWRKRWVNGDNKFSQQTYICLTDIESIIEQNWDEIASAVFKNIANLSA